MSVSRPAVRCLYRQKPVAPSTPSQSTRAFSTTPPQCARRRFRNISAETMGLIQAPTRSKQSAKSKFDQGLQDAAATLKPYTNKDKKNLTKQYTAQQQEVIDAGEEALSPHDLVAQGRVRTDFGGVPVMKDYVDDFSIVRPVVDFEQRPPPNPAMTKAKFMEDHEISREIDLAFMKASADYMVAQDEALRDHGMTREAWWEAECKKKGLDPEEHEDPRLPTQATVYGALQKIPMMKDKRTNEPIQNISVEARALPVMNEIASQFTKEEEPDERDPEGRYDKLISLTGMTLTDILKIRTKFLVRHRVVNQTRLGKISSQYVLAIAGDGKGMLGIGEGKSEESEDAMFKARFQAIRSMAPVPRYENRTIFGESDGKVAASVVQLFSRPPGFGLRVQSLIFEMARICGIEDLSAKTPRSRNKMNVVKATYEALMKQRLPDEVARGRGRKLVDVRKVYYGGGQPLPQSYLAFMKEERAKGEERAKRTV